MLGLTLTGFAILVALIGIGNHLARIADALEQARPTPSTPENGEA